MVSRKVKIPLVWLVVIGFLMAGCIGQFETPIEGEERQMWFQKAEPLAENILVSLENDDYKSFTRDFSEKMKNAIPEEDFSEVRDQLQSKAGSYNSLTPERVTKQGDYIIVYFTAQYEKDDVTVKLVINPDDPIKVQGLWFDS